MSNQLVGNVYQRIMDDVIENCQTTFEEDGVNQQTLDDLRKTWQTKLSALKIGTFPWEPPPVPQPMANPTLPSNFPKQPIPSSGPSLSTTPVPSNGGPVRIKTEPGYEGYQGSPSYGNTEAQQRAAAHLEQKFGANALQQIHQRQAQTAMGTPGAQPQRGPSNIQLPPPMSDQQRQDQADYKRRQQAQQYQSLQQAQQRPASNNGQTDGADDWEDYVAQRRLDASRNPSQSKDADFTIRQQVEQANRSMEGGGLMMPLAEQMKLPQAKKRKINTAGDSSSIDHIALVAAQSSDTKYLPQIAQLDGIEDDEEEDSKAGIKDELFGDDDDDEDAINSDLDDPDDNVIEEEQEEGRPAQIMLCTYDKVARVKNKWKCTLKDGVLTTGGKEYVFHRAQGEFEW
ncbi:transcription initiation factor TFIIA large subunit, partial [Lecanoromycetidae sp. Uapishka_2]